MKDKGLLNKGITVLKYVTIVVIAIAAVQITANRTCIKILDKYF